MDVVHGSQRKRTTFAAIVQSGPVDDAMKMEVPVPVIAQSVMQLLASRDGKQTWARSVAMMRHGFGEHPFGPDESVEHHRKSSRVGPFPDEPDE